MNCNKITQKKWFWFIFSFIVILIDQASKIGITKHFVLFESKPIIPMLNFTLAHNTGAAFSFLSNSGNWHQWFFTGFSFFMSLVLIVWIVRLPKNAQLQCAALSLILGGALGNLIDRLRLGYVIDFIDVYYKNYHWPDFNLADSAICLGAFLLFFELRKEI